MKLEPITFDEIIEEAYEDYEGETDNPLPQDKWIDTNEARESIRKWAVILGFRKEQS